jgi:hypothetical protein
MVERFVGLDVSQRLTSVCILDEQGKRVWRGKCTTEPGVIEATIRTRASGRETRLGIETGPLTPWLVHELRNRGLDVVCLDARQARSDTLHPGAEQLIAVGSISVEERAKHRSTPRSPAGKPHAGCATGRRRTPPGCGRRDQRRESAAPRSPRRRRCSARPAHASRQPRPATPYRHIVYSPWWARISLSPPFAESSPLRSPTFKLGKAESIIGTVFGEPQCKDWLTVTDCAALPR